MDGRHAAPPKNPWNDDFLQILTMASHGFFGGANGFHPSTVSQEPGQSSKASPVNLLASSIRYVCPRPLSDAKGQVGRASCGQVRGRALKASHSSRRLGDCRALPFVQAFRR